MTDLSKIDFSRCELPKWFGYNLRIAATGNGVTVSADTMQLLAKTIGSVWRMNSFSHLSESEIGELFKTAATVDRFIESELAKQAEPKWRPCSKEFALANPGCSLAANMNLNGSWSDWEQVGHWSYWGPDSEYRFQTTAPEPEPIDTRNPGRTYSAKAPATEPTITDLDAQLKRLRRRVRKLEKKVECV